MNWTRVLTIALAIGMIMLPMAVAGKRWTNASEAHASAQSAFAATVRDVNEIHELRSQQQRVEHRQRPEEHVLAQVNAVLADAGIPSRRLQSLRPEADVALPGTDGAYRRQSVQLSFQDLTLMDLGRFLVRWRDSQHIWTPQRIELTKRQGARSSDDAYDATILISAIYLAESTQQ